MFDRRKNNLLLCIWHYAFSFLYWGCETEFIPECLSSPSSLKADYCFLFGDHFTLCYQLDGSLQEFYEVSLNGQLRAHS